MSSWFCFIRACLGANGDWITTVELQQLIFQISINNGVQVGLQDHEMAINVYLEWQKTILSSRYKHLADQGVLLRKLFGGSIDQVIYRPDSSLLCLEAVKFSNLLGVGDFFKLEPYLKDISKLDFNSLEIRLKVINLENRLEALKEANMSLKNSIRTVEHVARARESLGEAKERLKIVREELLNLKVRFYELQDEKQALSLKIRIMK